MSSTARSQSNSHTAPDGARAFGGSGDRAPACELGQAAESHAVGDSRKTPAVIPTVLTIAGTDSSGGAGILADVKTVSALGGYACCAVTAVTAQNTQGVTDIHSIPPATISEQIRAVFADYPVSAVKIGMIGNEEAARAIVEVLDAVAEGVPVIWDPVMVASSGSALMDLTPGGERAESDRVPSDVTDDSHGADSAPEVSHGADIPSARPRFPDVPYLDLASRADVITPNGHELVQLFELSNHAAYTAGKPNTVASHNAGKPSNLAEEKSATSPTVEPTPDIEFMARPIASHLGTTVIVTGGADNAVSPAASDSELTDFLIQPAATPENCEVNSFTMERIHTENTHGTGCSFSSALAVLIAYRRCSNPTFTLSRVDWPPIIDSAHAYMAGALKAADTLDIALTPVGEEISGEHTAFHQNGNAPIDHFWMLR